jgi:hypothetical protein
MQQQHWRYHVNHHVASQGRGNKISGRGSIKNQTQGIDGIVGFGSTHTGYFEQLEFGENTFDRYLADLAKALQLGTCSSGDPSSEHKETPHFRMIISYQTLRHLKLNLCAMRIDDYH